MADAATIQTQLDEARAALHSLQMGSKAVSVKYDGREVTFNLTSAEKLEAYIRRLDEQLAAASGTIRRRRAMRVTF